MSEQEQLSVPTVAKQQRIGDALRQQIVHGELAPGARLPTQVQLIEQFGVSGVTVQRAINNLTREGFICTRGRNGTFVAANPPHLSNYGLVFMDQADRDTHRSRYHEMLESQAFRLQREVDRRVTVFNGISGHADDEGTRQLLADVRAHRMAGLMLVDPDTLEDNPLLEEQAIPRVAVMSCEVELPCPIVCPDIAGMIDLGLDTLVSAGRHRIAILTTGPIYRKHRAHLLTAIKRLPITVHDRWIQVTPHDLPEAVRNMVLLLMASGNSERPDGIFILDDNLAEAASTGLIEAGVRVPQDVSIVAHCNFPWLAPSVLPVTRVGFDTQAILDQALGVIDIQRRGMAPVAVTRAQAILQRPSEQS